MSKSTLFTMIALVFFPVLHGWAKDKKLVFNNHVIYQGEVMKKKPMGIGSLFIIKESGDEILSEYLDVIKGSFNDNVITEGKLIFAHKPTNAKDSTGVYFLGDFSYEIFGDHIEYNLQRGFFLVDSCKVALNNTYTISRYYNFDWESIKPSFYPIKKVQNWEISKLTPSDNIGLGYGAMAFALFADSAQSIVQEKEFDVYYTATPPAKVDWTGLRDGYLDRVMENGSSTLDFKNGTFGRIFKDEDSIGVAINKKNGDFFKATYCTTGFDDGVNINVRFTLQRGIIKYHSRVRDPKLYPKDVHNAWLKQVSKENYDTYWKYISYDGYGQKGVHTYKLKPRVELPITADNISIEFSDGSMYYGTVFYDLSNSNLTARTEEAILYLSPITGSNVFANGVYTDSNGIQTIFYKGYDINYLVALVNKQIEDEEQQNRLEREEWRKRQEERERIEKARVFALYSDLCPTYGKSAIEDWVKNHKVRIGWSENLVKELIRRRRDEGEFFNNFYLKLWYESSLTRTYDYYCGGLLLYTIDIDVRTGKVERVITH